MKTVKIKGIVRHYWDENLMSRPYRGQLKEIDDKTSIHLGDEMRHIMDEVADGSEFEIVVKVKDVRENTFDYIWKLVKPHTYERVRKLDEGSR